MKKILVVDNDRIVLRFMTKLLEEEGHQVAVAEDGLNALDILKTYTPDFIFVDLVMPNIDGRMLCRIIRSMPKFKDVYITIISAISVEEELDITEIRANACIAKGPLNEMAQYVLAVIEKPDLAAQQCLSGEILGIKSIFPRGITEELLSIKNHFEIILERMSEGVLEINSEGRIVFANPVALSLFNMPERNILGSDFIEVFPEDSRQRISNLMKIDGDKSKTITEDFPMRLNSFQVVIDIMPLVANDSKSIVIMHDVSKRKLGEKALLESETKYRSFAQIGLALSGEKDISTLLEIIVDNARVLSNADAGTLYILDDDKQHLRFEILQNNTMKTRMGGKSGDDFSLPRVPLYKDGKPNHSNVSSYTALTGKTINIPDVYEADGFDFTGPRKYDESTGYRSKSMLVIPLKNHENDIIGVLQLLNAQDPETREVVAFSPEHADLISSLASQAAVALTKTQLIHDLQDLFYAFIKSIATAIDEKSPYTGGHIRRVVDLAMMVIEKINETEEGSFKDVRFSEDEIEEMRMAAWMHDVGKITTPEYVVDKSTKLQTIFDRVQLIETRFRLISELIANRYLQLKNELLRKKPDDMSELDRLDKELESKIGRLNEELKFIKSCNDPGEFMSDEKIDRIHKIAEKTYAINDTEHPYLTEEEVKNLCIRKGTLTEEERRVVEHHATMTAKILNQLPFPRKLANVPLYAAGHHEKLDGSGYPGGLSKEDLPLQTKIMAVVDIFEALTATDRPYRKPLKLSEAVKIMGFMKKDDHIDPDIYDLFIGSRLYYDYAKREMDPKQID
ncbi:HD domain-containing phosphohydrolase [Thermodesulfobacteriota bacterium]